MTKELVTTDRREWSSSPSTMRDLSVGRGRRRPWAVVTALLVGVGLTACDTTAPAPEVGPEVLATWENGEIRVEDLDAYLLSLPPGARFPGPEEEPQSWLDRQVRELFERQVLLADGDAVAELEADPSFEEAWGQRSRTVLSRTWMEIHNEPFELTPADVKAVYDASPERWKSPERRTFRHLLRTFPADADEAARDAVCAEVEDLRRRIAGGASFEALTLRYSQASTAAAGGIVGAVSREQLRGDAGEMIFSLEAGSVSPVLRNRAGCQLFLVIQVIPAVDTSFELAQETLAGELIDQRRISWHLAKLEEVAAESGVELPDWLGGQAPADLAVDAVLFEHAGEEILSQDLFDLVRTGVSMPVALQNAIGDLLFSAALLEESPELAEERLAKAREAMVLDRLRRQELRAYLATQEETLLRERYEDRKTAYQSDPKHELTVYSWPIGAGDPLASLVRPRKLVTVLAGGGDPTTVWSDFESDPGIERQALPQLGIRQLVQRYPSLAPAVLEPREEGEVVGPFRCGDRICVTQVEVLIPARQLSFLEVQDQLRAELIREEGAAMEAEWSRELEERLGFQLYPEHLAGFGGRLIEGLLEGTS